MHGSTAALALFLGWSASTVALAQTPLMIDQSGLKSDVKLTVTSTAFDPDGTIPAKYSSYADGISPPLQWTSLITAKTYLVVVEDPDAKTPSPFLHWLVWDIPPAVTALPEGLRGMARYGLVQTWNPHGTHGYYGPHPPVGDPPHHYHFEVFALSRELKLPPGANRETVTAAATGHVLAKGELVATYQQDH